MDLALALRFVVGGGQLALAIALATRGGVARLLALLFTLRGVAGLFAAGSHVADEPTDRWLFLLAAAASLALVVAAFALALGAKRGRLPIAASLGTFLLALVAIAIEPRLYGELEAGRVDEAGPLVVLQALVWVGYAGVLARLARAEARAPPDPRARLALRLALFGFALDIAWVAMGALRALALGTPPRLLDHLLAESTWPARLGLALQLVGAAGLVVGAAVVLWAARQGRSAWALGAAMLAALAVAAAARWTVPAGPALALLDATWRLALPGLVAFALLRTGDAVGAVTEEAETEVEGLD